MSRTRASAKAAGATCSVCGQFRRLKHPHLAGDMCRPCAALRASRAAAIVNTTTTLQKFESYVERTDTCWLWRGTVAPNGYGSIVHNRKPAIAHRWAYEHFVGTIPAGLQLDHLCRVRACVNPAHLEPVTAQENTRRAMRSHCVNGHPFDAANTWLHRGKRYCRECRRRRVREYQARRAS